MSAIEIGGENGPKSGWSLPAFLSMKRWGQGGLREDDRGHPISLVIRRSGALLDGNLRVHSPGPNTPPLTEDPGSAKVESAKEQGGTSQMGRIKKETEGG